ncbi:group II intron reverse transcriptase/maturase, partial [uncultured Nostoc sp.]|uniref:group II intron reverse transcriptase/maturase n=1 Tax=uncultured Nostoc sp. TaxID=340711 RepID=UPI0035C964AA
MIEQVINRRNMHLAYQRVLANKGSAGTDGMGVKQLKQHLSIHREAIVLSIINGTYLPQPILGATIPKRNGKTRLLGIPTVTDRWLQQAVAQTITPLFEVEFKDHSYGFRPHKNAQQCLQQAQQYINEGYQHMVDIDLKSFFDEVDHCLLLQLLYGKVKCPIVLRLIRKWLRAPISIAGKLTKRSKGVPQGSPLSPLLSNIMLHQLDRQLEEQGLKYVRYADDFSIYAKDNSTARQTGNEVYLFLKNKLKLPINREKSGIRKPVQFELLGHRFVAVYEKGTRGKYQLAVSEKSWKNLKQSLKTITRKTAPWSIAERLSKLKAVGRGWLNYFRMASISSKLKEVDSWVRNRLRYCIWHDWKKPERKRKNLIRLGVDHRHAYAWSRTRKGGWAIAQSPILGTTVTLERLKKRGYESLLDYYLQVAPQLNEPLYTRPVRTV